MSLNKTLDRLFAEIRREVKRNPDFADRLDAVLRLHQSRREVSDDVVEEIVTEAPVSSPASGGSGRAEGADEGGKRRTPPLSQSAPRSDSSPPPKSQDVVGQVEMADRAAAGGGGAKEASTLNPVGYYKRKGEEALAAILSAHDLAALRALVAEHNLDPSGEAGSLDREALAMHVIAQAKRRAERDEKLFDY